MSDTLNRVKLQLRPVSISTNGSEKSPQSPQSAKLLINHGKPNYTIQRSPKAQQNGAGNPLSPEVQHNNRNNYNPYKLVGVQSNINGNNGTSSLSRTSSISSNTNGYSNGNGSLSVDGNTNGDGENNSFTVVHTTKFGDVSKPSLVSSAATVEPESDWVTLRRTPKPEPAVQSTGEENVPEFILRQRRIQERLAKENILDFENRRSGYFTHVVISPSSPNRTSFVETMASPAIVPSLEIPPSTKEQQKEETIVEEVVSLEGKTQQEAEQHGVTATNGTSSNGNTEEEEEEVANAIEEVNKAVAGELLDDDRNGEVVEVEQPIAVTVAVVTSALIDNEVSSLETSEEVLTTKAEVTTAAATTEIETPTTTAAIDGIHQAEVLSATVDHVEEEKVPQAVEDKKNDADITAQQEGPTQTNGYVANNSSDGSATQNTTISHTNGVNGASATNGNSIVPSLPAPDPSGALGVNYEPKTVVSFSKDLGGESNKYPDTVKVIKESGESQAASDDLKELSRLKFDIRTDDGGVQVTPVLRTD